MKKTLLEIKRTTTITTQAIAEWAKLPVADVFTVETGGYCSREKAQQVLTAFNQLSGLHVTLDDIHIHQASEVMIWLPNVSSPLQHKPTAIRS